MSANEDLPINYFVKGKNFQVDTLF